MTHSFPETKTEISHLTELPSAWVWIACGEIQRHGLLLTRRRRRKKTSNKNMLTALTSEPQMSEKERFSTECAPQKKRGEKSVLSLCMAHGFGHTLLKAYCNYQPGCPKTQCVQNKRTRSPPSHHGGRCLGFAFDFHFTVILILCCVKIKQK